MMALTDKEVLALKRVLVKDNSRATAVEISFSYRGLGGSNKSSASTDDGVWRRYVLRALDGAEIEYVDPWSVYIPWQSYPPIALRAVVGDVAYLETSHGVEKIPFGRFYLDENEIGYDTMGYYYVYLV